MNSKKRVYVAYTGGTIGMKQSANGYVPEPGFFIDELYKLPELSHTEMPDIVVKEYDSLIDSANVTPECWQRIAEDINNRYQDFDGFVILHGTDTMAYTASALSFTFAHLSKPVIITGSQIPLLELRSDARDNLIGALHIAANFVIPEVSIYFHNKLYRGNRTTKVDSNGFAAFNSPNYPVLASIGAQIQLNHHVCLPKPTKNTPMQLEPLKSCAVSALQLFPGIDARMIEHFLQQPMVGVVLKTYGKGNAPINNKDLMRVLKSANDRGIVIVNCTQCTHGHVNMDDYEAGQALSNIGVVSGNDMTTEAALTKLAYLNSKYGNDDIGKIKKAIVTDLRGELSHQSIEKK